MRLRPHHALCIQKFTGHGYDERFTEHMTEICEKLRNERETIVYITEGCDELCAWCPHGRDGVCSTLEKVADMDAAVRLALGLVPGGTVSWSELSRQAREKIFGTENFERICADCEWYPLCRS